MTTVLADLPDDVQALKAVIADLSGDLDRARVELNHRDLLIEKLKLQVANQLRHRFGTSAESLDQLQPMLEDLELARSAEAPVEPRATAVRQKPVRKPKAGGCPDERRACSRSNRQKKTPEIR
ncbi:MAG: transposase [Pseudomonadota bacterium]